MSARRLVAALVLAAFCAGAVPGVALAHGLVARADLPIPEWLFAWAASVVLIVSFLALATLWREPKLETERWRALPAPVGRLVTSRPVDLACGTLGALLLGVVVWSGVFGMQTAADNFAPTFVYVIFWLGLVPVSVLLGDVFRAFNPWRAIGRAVGWLAGRLARGGLPAALPYPERLGRWPAAAGILAFAWLEIVAESGDTPRSIAIATLMYSTVTFIAMALYGVERWSERGEAFSVYFNLFSRLSPIERRGRDVGLRPPLSRLTQLEPLAGTTALVAVMIGSVSFDGASAGPAWQLVVDRALPALSGRGLSDYLAIELTFGAGLIVAVALAYGLYRLGVVGARNVGGDPTRGRLGRAFIHSMVPIALVYAAAHYVSFLLLQGQDIARLISDPLGSGWDLFGTAAREVDYGLIGAEAIWYTQVALVVCGHVAALSLAHDRALVLYKDGRLATRSQVSMLAVMVLFTSLALWLLSQASLG